MLRLEPQCYEARLGLAVALQGSFANRSAPKHAHNEALRLLHEAIRQNPERPEAYYNLALFHSNVLAATATNGPEAIAHWDRAHRLFGSFLERAAPGADADAIRSAREWQAWHRETGPFIKERNPRH